MNTKTLITLLCLSTLVVVMASLDARGGHGGGRGGHHGGWGRRTGVGFGVGFGTGALLASRGGYYDDSPDVVYVDRPQQVIYEDEGAEEVEEGA